MKQINIIFLAVIVAFLLNLNTTYAQVNIGASNYTTLKEAFDAINAGTHTGAITINISSNTTETATATLNASGSGSANYTSVTINPSGAVSVYGNISGALISLNGADNITIDGLNSGGNSLTIENPSTATSATAVLIGNSSNGSSNITITNCTLLASSGYTSGAYDQRGVISLIGYNVSCDNVQISYCNIGASGGNRPASGINANYHMIITNDLTISHCNIYDYYSGGSNSAVGAGIRLGYLSNTTTHNNCTISDNSFYQTSTLTANGGKILGIYIHQGNNYTITNNYFGGSAPSCGGTAMAIDGTPYVVGFLHVDGHTSYGGIPNATGSNTFSGNVMSNINMYSSNTTNPTSNYTDGARFFCFTIHSGNWSITNNTIGSMSANNNIIIEDANQSRYAMMHIYGSISSSAGPVVSQISGNNIGGVTINSTNAEINLLYIWFESTGYKSQVSEISNNTFGSSIANSIQAPFASNSSQAFRGIRPDISNTTSPVNIHNNILQNVTLNNGSIYGITTYRDISIIGNTFRNLSTLGSTCSGIVISSNDNDANSNITGNLIYDLSATTDIKGIAATSYYRTVNTNNNIIVLGNSVSTNVNIYGIYQYYLANVYFNTVYIGGTGTSGTSNSYAYYRHSSWYSTTNVRNNVFYNARSNSGGTGTHYAAYFGSTSSLTVNYNNYYVSGTGGMLGYYSGNIASLPNANLGANSINTNPVFVSAGSTTASDYRPTVAMTGVSGTGITTDYQTAFRPATPTMGAIEYGVNKWVGSVSTDFNTAGNWSYGTVPLSGESIEFVATPSNHCILDQNRTLGSITNAQSTYDLVLNGKNLTVTGLLNFTNAAEIDGNIAASGITFAGTSAQTIPADMLVSATLPNLTINNASGVTIASNITITSLLTFTAGILNTGAFTLILADNATSAGNGTGKYVDGNLQKTGDDEFIFPVGNGGVYAPIKIGAPALTTDHFTASFHYTDPTPTYNTNLHDVSLDHVCTQAYWMLNRTGGSSNVAVTMYWDNSSGITTPADIRVARWNGSQWDNEGNAAWAGDANSGWLTSNTIINFSPFTFASVGAGNPLPVELLNFEAVANDKTVDLNWITASEINSAYFEIEKPDNSDNWISIGKIDAAGNSTTVNQYHLTDHQPKSGINFYRLKQVDIDGKTTYSEIVSANINSNNTPTVFPCPANNFVTVQLNNTEFANTTISVINASGIMVIEQTTVTGLVTSIDISDLTPGLYFVQTSNGNEMSCTPLVVN